MQTSRLYDASIRVGRYLDSVQVAFVRAVIEQEKFRKALRWGVMALLLFYAAISLNASADDSMLGLDAIDSKFSGLRDTWYSVVKGFAVGLFWKLALVDFCWSTVIYVLEKNEMPEILGSLVRKIFTLGFFFSVLKMSDTWIPAIIQSFIKIGQTASGVGSLTPDGIVNKGLDLAFGAFGALKDLNALKALGAIFPVTLMALLIFLAFLWVAAQLLVTLVESYIAIGLGVILLGFGGSRWTTDFATKYLQFAVGTGIKLMVLYAIVGGGQSLFTGLVIDQGNLLKSCLIVMGTSFVYTFLAINIPQLASSMMSGSPNLTAGALAGATATVAAAAVGAGAATAAAGSAAAGGAVSGAAGAAGLKQALDAGLASAGDHGKTGLGALGHAAGEMAAHGLGMASGAVGSAAESAREAFGGRVDQSAGGKIASSIESTRGGSVAGVPAAAPAPAPASNAGQAAPAAGGSAGAGGAAGGQGNPDAGSTQGGALSSDSAPADASQAASSASASASTEGAGSAPAGASGGGVSAPTKPAASGSAPAVPPAPAVAPTSAGGDASNAAVSGASTDAGAGGGAGQASGQSGTQGSGKRTPSVTELKRDLEGYIPQDGASGAAINIDISHARD
ncbi:P-type conjugative transfer protein TrbL [Ralstonia insidiosa]|uniref:P-type conjugative transfer protein TrbL n=1 Tax=Ralstonia insidiosa TaxID=190721 RepID=A0A848P328_9RALS|nr:P-type conjugative transfer protein TrbL [Ralstonia insidiosa]NMV39917.1 P-type conjugative transfer protein TrbL [Ralstonia insidiosa]